MLGPVDIDGAREILDLAREVEAHIVDEDAGDWVRHLEARVADIEPAIDALVDSGDPDSALDLAGALSIFWQDIGKVDDGRRFTETLLQKLDSHPRIRALARAQLVLGELAFRQGDQVVATRSSSEAENIAVEVGDAWVSGRAALNLARVAFRDGDAARIFEHAERALEGAGNNERLRSGAIHMLGWAEYTAGNVAGAMARFEENAALYRERGDQVGQAGELANLADLAMESSDLDRAKRYLADAFAVPGVGGNRYLVPSLIRSRGVLAALEGNHELGLELIAASEALFAEFGLVGDPGDELTRRVRQSAIDALGPRAAKIESRGRARSLEEAVALSAS